MLFGHGMVHGDKMLVLHILNGKDMRLIFRFRLQRRQGYPAAADDRVSGGMHHIAADGTDIEFAPQHIAGDVLIGDMFAVHQFYDGDSQGQRQRLQQGNIRQSLCRFPFGDSLAADTDFFRQFRLGQIPPFPQLLYGRSGHIGIHAIHILSENSIPRTQPGSNLRFVDRTLTHRKKAGIIAEKGVVVLQQKQFKQANILLLVCAMACLVCYDIFGGLWLKGVTSGWFVLLGSVNLWAARKQRPLLFFLLIEAGLICGMCADILLGVAFFAGVGVFALGHILYLAAFCVLEKFCLRDLKIILPLALVSVFLVFGTPWITVRDPLLRKMLLGYALIISAMLGKAVSNLVCCPSLFRRLLVVGSALFWFSDLILAVDMFGQSSRLTWILCSYCYWPAQNILAHSLYHADLIHTE